MLRVHFDAVDLARTRMCKAPDPLWEVAISMHRLETRQGRWAHADWYRVTSRRLRERGLDRPLRRMLLPMYPRAAYYPDFLTPWQAREGLEAGLEAIIATDPGRIRAEVAELDRVAGSPPWAARLHEPEVLRDFVRLLRLYHDVAIAPFEERVQARLEAERALKARELMDGGVEGMLSSLGPSTRWERPVLSTAYHPARDRDLWLAGRGLLLVPSYFLLERPIALADPRLPPVLVYPLVHEPSAALSSHDPGASLTALLGRGRAVALRTVANGATTGEVARVAGVSAASASRNVTALRDVGLVTSHRVGPSVLHTITPTGAALLRSALGHARIGTRAAGPGDRASRHRHP
ncbi:helix-turn-helix domain-containing protein [Streptomyces sp. ZYX-F-203]